MRWADSEGEDLEDGEGLETLILTMTTTMTFGLEEGEVAEDGVVGDTMVYLTMMTSAATVSTYHLSLEGDLNGLLTFT